MQQVGVRRQYALDESEVIENPDELQDNAGEVCTAENVNECIKDLMALGYGGGKEPHELAAEQVIFQSRSWKAA